MESDGTFGRGGSPQAPSCWAQDGSQLGPMLGHLGVRIPILVPTKAASTYEESLEGFHSQSEVAPGGFRVVNIGVWSTSADLT